MVSTRNIVHPCLDVSVINNVSDIPRSICNKKKGVQAVQRHPIFIYDADHDYILYKMDRRDHIEY